MRDGRLVAEAPVGRTRPRRSGDRDGRRVLCRGPADEPREARSGRRRRSGRRPIARPIVLDVEFRLGRRAVSDVSLRSAPANASVSPGSPDRARPSSPRRSSASGRPRAGRVSVGGRPLRPGRVDLARDSGIGYVPEDRHANGLLRQPLGRGEHRAAGSAADQPVGLHLVGPAPRSGEFDDRQAADQGQRPDPEHQRAFRRQPAEDGDGAGARVGAERPRARLSDRRRRHRGQAGAVRHHHARRTRRCFWSRTRSTNWRSATASW